MLFMFNMLVSLTHLSFRFCFHSLLPIFFQIVLSVYLLLLLLLSCHFLPRGHWRLPLLHNLLRSINKIIRTFLFRCQTFPLNRGWWRLRRLPGRSSLNEVFLISAWIILDMHSGHFSNHIENRFFWLLLLLVDRGSGKRSWSCFLSIYHLSSWFAYFSLVVRAVSVFLASTHFSF